jgi:2-methylcitrate dehydratase PrpD
MTIANKFAEFIEGISYSDLPSRVLSTSQLHILDTIGVAICGRTHQNSINALNAISDISKFDNSTAVWGSKTRLSPEYAALVNGVSSHVLDYDDTHTDSIVHGSAVIVPVVLALGEKLNVSGEDLIKSFVLGWEVASRVGLASKGGFHKRGFHTTSIAGVFGATAAAASMMKLNASQIQNALGLAGSQVSGINEYLSNSSSSKSLHTGWSAHAGIIAAQLAKYGMTGPESVFEGRDGIFRTYGLIEQCDLTKATENLGSKWEVCEISIKPYPCCHFAHAFIDCIGSLVSKGLSKDDVASITCVVPELEQALICEPYQDKLKPQTSYGAKFSLPYLLATKFIDGAIDHDTFSAENIKRSDLLDFAKLVQYKTANPNETVFPKSFPGHLLVKLKSGQILEERLDINNGHPSNPLSQDLIIKKFKTNCKGVLSDEGINKVIDLITNLQRSNIADVGSATQLLHR